MPSYFDGDYLSKMKIFIFVHRNLVKGYSMNKLMIIFVRSPKYDLLICKDILSSKYLPIRFILGVLSHTTASGDDETLR